MTSCCDPSGYSGVFDHKQGARDLRRYRRRGLEGLIAGVVRHLRGGVAGATVLEVGGGIGAVQAELLGSGAARAINVDISDGYEAAAAELASELGLETTRRVVGDFIDEATALPDADIVVMNRVVCCYPDMVTLVATAASKTARSLAMVFPRDQWFMRLLRGGIALRMRLARNSFRFYVHDPDRIVAVAAGSGLVIAFSEKRLGWQAVVMERPSSRGGVRPASSTRRSFDRPQH